MLVIVVIMSSVCIGAVMTNVQDVRHTMAKESLSMDSFVFCKYFDNMLSSKVELLNNMAECISSAGLHEPMQMNAVLARQNTFNQATIIDNYGNVLCGDDYDGSEFRDQTYYSSLMDGKNIVASRTETDSNGKEVIRFYAPIREKGQTTMTIVASVLASDYKNMLDSADYVGEGCLCVINEYGDYIVGDTRFDEMLSDKESNHFTHVGSSKVLSGVKDAKELEGRIQENSAASITYRYAGEVYSAKYVPLSVNGWHLVSTIPVSSVGNDAPVLSSATIILEVITVLIVCTFLVLVVLLVIKYRRIRRENTRHIMVEKCDPGVTFQMTFKPHKLNFYGDVKNIVGTELAGLKGEAVYDVFDWLHEDDRSLRSRFNSFWESDETTFSAEARIRNIQGDFGWYRIVGILDKDAYGNNKTFIGKIINVNEELNEEKQLIQRAENDLLTGILNKKTMEKRIALMINNRGGKYVILYMVDLDNFKNVNDILGHIYGDQAIVETAQCLNKVFANQDCIGRLGGDEFAVCVSYQAFDEQSLLDFIRKKAEQICAVNRRTYTDNASEVSITSSVGIAYAPDMGQSFEDLYAKADRALYFSKENGKDQYHIYSQKDSK